MPNRLTTEDFIKRAEEIHGKRYGYEKVEYKTLNDKVIINCEEHGDFKQIPVNHLIGKGCRECRIDATRGTTEGFTNRAKKNSW